MNADVVLPWSLLALVSVVSLTTVTGLTVRMRRLRRNGRVLCGTHSHRWIDRIDDFERVAADSGLVDAQRMRNLITEFRHSAGRSVALGETIAALSAFLVSRDILTCWQVGKLRQGQYKGFYEIPGYRLLDRLGDATSEPGSEYLAECMATGEVVDLEVFPAGRSVGHRITRVVGQRHAPDSGD